MKTPALSPDELSLITSVLQRHSEITAVSLFGSRAKGTHATNSDVDLAVWGNIDALKAEEIAAELDDLPLPYRFDVKPFSLIKLATLREHIERVGLRIYPIAR
jgi:predicted nucleotidyltransferase